MAARWSAVVIVGLVLAGCSSSGDGDGSTGSPEPTTTQPTESTTSTTASTTTSTTASTTTSTTTSTTSTEPAVDTAALEAAFGGHELTLLDAELTCLAEAGYTTADADELFDGDGSLPVENAAMLDGCIDAGGREAIMGLLNDRLDVDAPPTCFATALIDYVVDNGFVSAADGANDTLLQELFVEACPNLAGSPTDARSPFVAAMVTNIYDRFELERTDAGDACLTGRINMIDEWFDVESISVGFDGDVAALDTYAKRAFLEVGLAPFACDLGLEAPYDLVTGQDGVSAELRDDLVNGDAGGDDADTADLLAGAVRLVSDGGDGDSDAAQQCATGYMAERLAAEPASALLERILAVDVSDPATNAMFAAVFNCTSGQTDWTAGEPAIGDIQYP